MLSKTIETYLTAQSGEFLKILNLY